METKDLIKRAANLPTNIEDLTKYVILTNEVLTAQKAQLRAIKKIQGASDFFKSKLKDTQELAGITLKAEVKLGDFLDEIEVSKNAGRPKKEIGNHAVPIKKKKTTLEDLGIDKKLSAEAQKFSDYEGLVDKEIARAKKENDVPTKANILRDIQEHNRTDKKKPAPPLPTGKYNLIYADPPWQYSFAASSTTKVENHYPTMTIEEICDIDIQKIAADDCVLYMWITAPKLNYLNEILNAWGFEYKTCGVWDKVTMGMGYWFFGQHEILIIATRGHVSPPEVKERGSSVYSEKKTKHSKKPEYYYELIERNHPGFKKIELFARAKREGWTMWGDDERLQ